MRKVFIEDLIEYDLGLEKGCVSALASKADTLYSRFELGDKIIDIPAPRLKIIQCWISDFVRRTLCSVPLYVTAYETGCSIIKNASLHRDNAHILNLDISDFFHSCSKDKVMRVLQRIKIAMDDGTTRVLDDHEIDLLAKIACCGNSLCIGSPSSPALANRIMLPIDEEIIGKLDANVTYSRYSDDMIISSNTWIDSQKVENTVESVLNKNGFVLNRRKTKCLGKGDRRKVTGVFICPDGSLSIGSKRKRAIKSNLYNFLVHNEGNPSHILGLIYFAIQVEPEWAANLLIKYANYGKAQNSSVIEALGKQ